MSHAALTDPVRGSMKLLFGFGMALLPFQWFEQPILRFKRRFTHVAARD